MDQGESLSLDVRKVDNGYILRKSCSGPNGYECTETFSKDKPDLNVLAAPPSGRKAQSGLSGAVKYLRGHR